MAKFSGEVGYGDSIEDPPDSGVWVEQITEKHYYGDVVRNSRRFTGEGVNEDVGLDNQISVVADPYAVDNFTNIKYVKWAGKPWKVTSVEIHRPRLILTLGSVYNGPTATTS